MNKLSSTVIGRKTPLNIWSGRAAQDYDLLKVFGCPAYICTKYGKLNPRVKKYGTENKKIVLSKHVTFDETSFLKSAISHQVERMKTKDVLQRVKVDATPPYSVGSISVRISPDMTPSGDHVLFGC